MEIRPIDANALLTKTHNYYPSIDQYCCSRKAVDMKDIIAAPTIDAVQVVRCKDCKRFVTMEGGIKISFCNEYGGEVTESDYCSRAKRRESNAGN